MGTTLPAPAPSPPHLASPLASPRLTMGNKNGVPVLRDEDVAALVKSSGMEEAQVRESFEAFKEQHPNGKMKPKDFREMMAKAMPKKDASKMEKHVFRIYDSNNDGYIEFIVIFHIMSDGSPEEVLGKIFRVFDVNSDGTINAKEMKRLIKDMYGLIKADDPEAQSQELIAKSAFAEMDEDKDGKITCAEFTAACLSRDEISKMLALKVIDIFVEED